MQLRLLLCQFVCLSVYLRLLLKHFSIDISLSSLHVSRSYNFSPPFFAPSRMRNMWRPDSNAPKWDTSHNNNNNKHIPYFLCEREREREIQTVCGIGAPLHWLASSANVSLLRCVNSVCFLVLSIRGITGCFSFFSPFYHLLLFVRSFHWFGIHLLEATHVD